MKRWIRDHGLTLALLGLFLFSLTGQVVAGVSQENQERLEHARPAVALGGYLASGPFLSALFENWESEFLQMGVYVVLTAYLFQRGSPESRDPERASSPPRGRKPPARQLAQAPWPVRHGGWVREVYAHSLGIALFLLFAVSFVLHWLNSFRKAAEEALEHHRSAPHLLSYLGDAQFWFESFQNWQSEFLSTAVLILLAIYLRERGSPESKPEAAPHSRTGG